MEIIRDCKRVVEIEVIVEYFFLQYDRDLYGDFYVLLQYDVVFMNGIQKFEIERFLECLWSDIKEWVWKFDQEWNSQVEWFLEFLKLKFVLMNFEVEFIVGEREFSLDCKREK